MIDDCNIVGLIINGYNIAELIKNSENKK